MLPGLSTKHRESRYAESGTQKGQELVRRPDDEAQPKESEKSGHQTLPQSNKFLGFPDFSLHTVRLNQGPASENPQVSKTLFTPGNYGLQEETLRRGAGNLDLAISH